MSAVLVVDDEAGMRETLSDILQAAGYQVAVAVDGQAALEQLSAGGYDVVVMDVRMPRMDGVTVLHTLGGPPPHVILMTAYALEDQLAQAKTAFAVVQKPFQVPVLLELVQRASGSAA